MDTLINQLPFELKIEILSWLPFETICKITKDSVILHNAYANCKYTLDDICWIGNFMLMKYITNNEVYSVNLLDYCCEMGNLLGVKSLISLGYNKCSNVYVVNNTYYRNKIKILKLLVENGNICSERVVRDVIKSGDISLLTFLIKNGCKISNLGNSFVNNIEILKILIESKNTINTIQVSEWACIQGNLDIIKYLVENNMKISDLAKKYASDNGQYKIVKYLNSIKIKSKKITNIF